MGGRVNLSSMTSVRTAQIQLLSNQWLLGGPTDRRLGQWKALLRQSSCKTHSKKHSNSHRFFNHHCHQKFLTTISIMIRILSLYIKCLYFHDPAFRAAKLLSAKNLQSSNQPFPIQGWNEGLQLSSVESHQVDDEHCH